MTYFIESLSRSWTVSLGVNYHEGKLKKYQEMGKDISAESRSHQASVVLQILKKESLFSIQLKWKELI